MQRLSGFTLIELLIVMAIISISSLAVFNNYIGSSANQRLRSSADKLSDTLKLAHVYSRESKDLKTWGVKKAGAKKYELVTYTTDPAVTETFAKYTLEENITFVGGFTIWFTRGTGETSTPLLIQIKNVFGKIQFVEILASGIVNVKS